MKQMIQKYSFLIWNMAVKFVILHLHGKRVSSIFFNFMSSSAAS